MTAPDPFSGQFFSALGWALFHFLWQGAVVAGIVAVFGLLLAKRPPLVRYALACAVRSDLGLRTSHVSLACFLLDILLSNLSGGGLE